VSHPAVRAEGLGKHYALGRRRRHDTLRDLLTFSVAAPLRALRHGNTPSVTPAPAERVHWALRDVSFEVPRGQVLGIIGRNGAGKSTLLKILCRIVNPSTGRAEIRGRVGSLLEVGTGFHSELTGRENIYLNGAILGMRKAEIERQFDEIVSFAETGHFLDTPVKHYSSGMRMRLAFAVAAHLETQVLLVDEVLAVGDAAFQRKCIGKIGAVAQTGRTVLFVSHQLEAVQRLCSRCLLLENGAIVKDGTSAAVIATYLSRISARARPNSFIDLSQADRVGTGQARFSEVQYGSDRADIGFQPYTNGPLDVWLVIHSDAARSVGSLAVTIYNQLGTKLVNADTHEMGETVLLKAGINRLRLRIGRLHLNPGLYRLGLWLANPMDSQSVRSAYDFVEWAFDLEVLGDGPLGPGFSSEGAVACEFTVEDVSG
jgi:ABC-type polysaccharide/polyol phosphate transport system ATPase subunit